MVLMNVVAVHCRLPDCGFVASFEASPGSMKQLRRDAVSFSSP
jgi:hypothetical protein